MKQTAKIVAAFVAGCVVTAGYLVPAHNQALVDATHTPDEFTQALRDAVEHGDAIEASRWGD